MFPWHCSLPELACGLAFPPGSWQTVQGALTAFQPPPRLSTPEYCFRHLMLLISFILETCLCDHVDFSGCQATASSARMSTVSGRAQFSWFQSLCTMQMFPHGLVPWSPPSFCCLLLCLIFPRSFPLYITVTPPISSNVSVLSPTITLKIKINRPGHSDPL